MHLRVQVWTKRWKSRLRRRWCLLAISSQPPRNVPEECKCYVSLYRNLVRLQILMLSWMSIVLWNMFNFNNVFNHASWARAISITHKRGKPSSSSHTQLSALHHHKSFCIWITFALDRQKKFLFVFEFICLNCSCPLIRGQGGWEQKKRWRFELHCIQLHLTYIVWIILVLWLEDKMCESADKDEDAVEGEGD